MKSLLFRNQAHISNLYFCRKLSLSLKKFYANLILSNLKSKEKIFQVPALHFRREHDGVLEWYNLILILSALISLFLNTFSPSPGLHTGLQTE